MSQRVLGTHAHVAARAGLDHVLSGVRVALTGGFLAFGIWSALPALGEIELTPFALPTPVASAQPAASTAASGAITVQAALSRAQQGRTPVAVAVSLTDRDLTRAAEPYFPQTYAGVTVSSPSIRATSGRIVLSANARSFVGSGPLVASATPYAGDGRLMVRVDSVTLGGMSLPDGMRAHIAQQLQAAIDASMGSRLQVSSVTASQGMLTVKGVAFP